MIIHEMCACFWWEHGSGATKKLYTTVDCRSGMISNSNAKGLVMFSVLARCRYKRQKAGAHCSIVFYFTSFSVQPYQFFLNWLNLYSYRCPRTRMTHISIYFYLDLPQNMGKSSYVMSLTCEPNPGYTEVASGFSGTWSLACHKRQLEGSREDDGSSLAGLQGITGVGPWVDLFGFRLLLLLLLLLLLFFIGV